jgi:small acid-soluble spore protein A (major alpha-type SASP)
MKVSSRTRLEKILRSDTCMKNKLIVPNSELVIQQLKEEIAAEFGIQYGADVSARDNGRIGGEITKRLIELGKQQLMDRQ